MMPGTSKDVLKFFYVGTLHTKLSVPPLNDRRRAFAAYKKDIIWSLLQGRSVISMIALSCFNNVSGLAEGPQS